MAGWGKLLAGAVLGVAGTLYATNEEVRKQLPKAARDFPEVLRSRYKSAVSAAREAAAERRAEILRELEHHGGGDRGVRPNPEEAPPEQVKNVEENG